MSAPLSSALFGATGLVGGHMLSAMLALDGFGPVHTITRRAPPQAAAVPAVAKLDAIVEPDTAKWTEKLEPLKAALVVSAVGTTRAAAGGIANQWKIDHDLNVDIARAAKAAGATTYVFISSAGTRAPLVRSSPYARMKNGVEDTINELGFAQTIIVHPGLIMGTREVGHEHVAGDLMNSIVRGLGRWVSQGVQDTVGQEAEVIGRAAVHAALLASQGKAPSAHWVLENKDIVRLGRDEWKF